MESVRCLGSKNPETDIPAILEALKHFVYLHTANSTQEYLAAFLVFAIADKLVRRLHPEDAAFPF